MIQYYQLAIYTYQYILYPYTIHHILHTSYMSTTYSYYSRAQVVYWCCQTKTKYYYMSQYYVHYVLLYACRSTTLQYSSTYTNSTSIRICGRYIHTYMYAYTTLVLEVVRIYKVVRSVRRQYYIQYVHSTCNNSILEVHSSSYLFSYDIMSTTDCHMAKEDRSFQCISDFRFR